MSQCFNPQGQVTRGARVPGAFSWPRPTPLTELIPAPPLGGGNGAVHTCPSTPLRALRRAAHARPGPAGRLRGRGDGGGRPSLEARQVRAAGVRGPGSASGSVGWLPGLWLPASAAAPARRRVSGSLRPGGRSRRLRGALPRIGAP